MKISLQKKKLRIKTTIKKRKNNKIQKKKFMKQMKKLKMEKNFCKTKKKLKALLMESMELSMNSFDFTNCI